MLLKKRSTPKSNAGDFMNDKVIAVRKYDSRVGSLYPRHCYYSQSCEGPIYLVIDRRATDEELTAMAAKLSLPLPKMLEFRDTHAV